MFKANHHRKLGRVGIDIILHMQNHHKQGYTLLEISFVIIIISIIIAGISTATTLIKQANLKTIITESTSLTDSINTFQQKYGALPGDFPDASSIWGTLCDPTPSYCDGNGDGYILYTTSTNQNESLRAWQHLSLAGMIKGYYTGTSTVAGQSDIGINAPPSNYNNGGWSLYRSNPYIPPAETKEGQFMQVGSFKSGGPCSNPLLTPLDAFSVDNKVDDGFPRNGMLLGFSLAKNCYTSVTLTSTYNVSLKNNACILKFVFRKN